MAHGLTVRSQPRKCQAEHRAGRASAQGLAGPPAKAGPLADFFLTEKSLNRFSAVGGDRPLSAFVHIYRHELALDLLPVIETDDAVTFLERRQRGVDGLGGAFTLERRESVAHRVNRRALSFRRIDGDPIAHFFQP